MHGSLLLLAPLVGTKTVVWHLGRYWDVEKPCLCTLLEALCWTLYKQVLILLHAATLAVVAAVAEAEAGTAAAHGQVAGRR
jgi:hypothetical protein